MLTEIVAEGGKNPLKTKVSEEQEVEVTGCESSISSSPTTVEDDFPFFSDIPIRRVGTVNKESQLDKEVDRND